MLPAVFEPKIPASERPQIYALDRAASAIDNNRHISYLAYLFDLWTLAIFRITFDLTVRLIPLVNADFFLNVSTSIRLCLSNQYVSAVGSE
jgi:hypothetical protein